MNIIDPYFKFSTLNFKHDASKLKKYGSIITLKFKLKLFNYSIFEKIFFLYNVVVKFKW